MEGEIILKERYMENPNKNKNIFPDEEYAPAKPLYTKKIKAPYGTPGEDLTEVEREVSTEEAEALPINAKLNVIGKRTKRLDAVYKVTGAAKYTADIQLPGMLYGKFVRSIHPHARIRSVDTSKAEKMAGVHAVHVLTTDPITDPVAPTGDKLPVVRYVGQPIAAVAAETQELADEAAKLVEVVYHPLPFVIDLDEAQKPNATLVYEQKIEQRQTEGDVGNVAGGEQRGNVRGPNTRSRGDLEKGFAEADILLEREYRTQVQTHCTLETHGVVADWKSDGLTVYASTQGTKGVRDELAEIFNLPVSKVRVITEYMGAGFGSKFGAGNYGAMATMLSKKAGRPVRLMLNRWEEQHAAGNRPNSHQKLKIGAKKDGTLTAMQLVAYGTGGVNLGAGVGSVARSMYTCPNYKGEQNHVFTHAGPGAAFRAPGAVQGLFALEQAIDELAVELNMDPVKLRDVIDPSKIRSIQRRKAAEKFGWKYRPANSDTGPVKRGIGMAQGQWHQGINFDSSATVRINKDSSVEIRSGVQDIGTGIRTVVAQVVAEELGLQAEDITVKIGDTTYPAGPGSGGSVTTGSITPAVRNAAYQAKMKLLADVAGEMKTEIADLMMKNGEVISRKDPSNKMSFTEATGKMRADQVMATATRSANYPGSTRDALGSVQFAEVTVDTETGVIKVERIVAAHTCGRPMNPLQIESQINGGVIMGVGFALYEDRVMDVRTGYMVNPNLEMYKMPFSKEIPDIDIILIEHYSAQSSTDATGIGEPANIATAPAIANAVYNAIGVRIYETPMSPEKVLAALGVV